MSFQALSQELVDDIIDYLPLEDLNNASLAHHRMTRQAQVNLNTLLLFNDEDKERLVNHISGLTSQLNRDPGILKHVNGRVVIRRDTYQSSDWILRYDVMEILRSSRPHPGPSINLRLEGIHPSGANRRLFFTEQEEVYRTIFSTLADSVSSVALINTGRLSGSFIYGFPGLQYLHLEGEIKIEEAVQTHRRPTAAIRSISVVGNKAWEHLSDALSFNHVLVHCFEDLSALEQLRVSATALYDPSIHVQNLHVLRRILDSANNLCNIQIGSHLGLPVRNEVIQTHSVTLELRNTDNVSTASRQNFIINVIRAIQMAKTHTNNPPINAIIIKFTTILGVQSFTYPTWNTIIDAVERLAHTFGYSWKLVIELELIDQENMLRYYSNEVEHCVNATVSKIHNAAGARSVITQVPGEASSLAHVEVFV